LTESASRSGRCRPKQWAFPDRYEFWCKTEPPLVRHRNRHRSQWLSAGSASTACAAPSRKASRSTPEREQHATQFSYVGQQCLAVQSRAQASPPSPQQHPSAPSAAAEHTRPASSATKSPPAPNVFRHFVDGRRRLPPPRCCCPATVVVVFGSRDAASATKDALTTATATSSSGDTTHFPRPRRDDDVVLLSSSSSFASALRRVDDLLLVGVSRTPVEEANGRGVSTETNQDAEER